MKKILRICALLGCLVLLTACAGEPSAEQAGEWDCSVQCAAGSTEEAYVVTYSDQKIVTQLGALTFCNPNDFAVTVHLLAEGEAERMLDVPAGNAVALDGLSKGGSYTVGCHADVAEDTQIRLTALDGSAGNEP